MDNIHLTIFVVGTVVVYIHKIKIKIAHNIFNKYEECKSCVRMYQGSLYYPIKWKFIIYACLHFI